MSFPRGAAQLPTAVGVLRSVQHPNLQQLLGLMARMFPSTAWFSNISGLQEGLLARKTFSHSFAEKEQSCDNPRIIQSGLRLKLFVIRTRIAMDKTAALVVYIQQGVLPSCKRHFVTYFPRRILEAHFQVAEARASAPGCWAPAVFLLELFSLEQNGFGDNLQGHHQTLNGQRRAKGRLSLGRVQFRNRPSV